MEVGGDGSFDSVLRTLLRMTRNLGGAAEKPVAAICRGWVSHPERITGQRDPSPTGAQVSREENRKEESKWKK